MALRLSHPPLGQELLSLTEHMVKSSKHRLGADIRCLESEGLHREALAVLAPVKYARNSLVKPIRHLHAGAIRPVPILHQSHQSARQLHHRLIPPPSSQGSFYRMFLSY
jgi:hypothetical protein